MSYWPQTQITYSDTPMFDAFGRLRSSTPETLFDSKLTRDSALNAWDDVQTSGSGTTSTYSKNRASVTLAVAGTTAGKRVRQTKVRHDYQPGKGQLILVTFVMGAAASGITKRVGYHTDQNGIFLQQTSTDLRFVIRTNVTGTPSDANSATQANWNIDKMNGSGPSKVTLDITKSQIMFIEFEWLGVGRVKVGFVVDGLYVPCHQFLNANVNASVYMSTPNLPVRYSIENDGTGAASSLECICASVVSEGGHQEVGKEHGITRYALPLTTGNDFGIYPVFAMRLNGSYLGGNVRLASASLVCTTTSAFNYYWLENPTLQGGSFLWTDVPTSAVQVAYQNTGTISVIPNTGTLLRAGCVAATTYIEAPTNSEERLGSFINGTADVWVIAVQRLSTSAETFYGGMNWVESGG